MDKVKLANLVNGDDFVCMLCGNKFPHSHGVRRSINTVIDVFHCVGCLQIDEADVLKHVEHGVKLPPDPRVEAVVSRVMDDAIEFISKRNQMN